VYAASEQQYTAAGGEVEVPIGAVFTGTEHQEMNTLIGEANAVLRELYQSVDKTGAFKHRKSCQFLYRSLFRSLPMAMVMNLGL